MTMSRPALNRIAWPISIAALVASIVAAACIGQVPIDLNDPTGRSILFDIRLPRIFVGACCGLALSVAGTLCQGLFRNPLATPSVIGTEAAAAASAALVYYLAVGQWLWFAMPAAACGGAIIATVFVLRAANSRYGLTIENLLLIGFSLTAFLGAFTSLIISLSLESHQQQGGLLYWLFGDLNSRSWDHLQWGLPTIIFGLSVAWPCAYKLNVLSLGDDIATTLQINVARLRKETIFAIAVLVGGSVAMAGTIPFVGFIVPHVTRRLFGAEHRRLLMLSGINGMTLVILADLVARMIRRPYELQVGIIIALVSAPVFGWLLITDQQKQQV